MYKYFSNIVFVTCIQSLHKVCFILWSPISLDPHDQICFCCTSLHHCSPSFRIPFLHPQSTLLMLRLPDLSSNAVVYTENTSGTVCFCHKCHSVNQPLGHAQVQCNFVFPSQKSSFTSTKFSAFANLGKLFWKHIIQNYKQKCNLLTNSL